MKLWDAEGTIRDLKFAVTYHQRKYESIQELYLNLQNDNSLYQNDLQNKEALITRLREELRVLQQLRDLVGTPNDLEQAKGATLAKLDTILKQLVTSPIKYHGTFPQFLNRDNNNYHNILKSVRVKIQTARSVDEVLKEVTHHTTLLLIRRQSCQQAYLDEAHCITETHDEKLKAFRMELIAATRQEDAALRGGGEVKKWRRKCNTLQIELAKFTVAPTVPTPPTSPEQVPSSDDEHVLVPGADVDVAGHWSDSTAYDSDGHEIQDRALARIKNEDRLRKAHKEATEELCKVNQELERQEAQRLHSVDLVSPDVSDQSTSSDDNDFSKAISKEELQFGQSATTHTPPPSSPEQGSSSTGRKRGSKSKKDKAIKSPSSTPTPTTKPKPKSKKRHKKTVVVKTETAAANTEIDLTGTEEKECSVCVPGSGKLAGHVGAHRRKL
jgi:hypothetical protein